MAGANCDAVAQDTSVLTYHGDFARNGAFVVPGLTWERARALHLDTGFEGYFSGHVYAQPLYWRDSGPGSGLLIVVTEEDGVHALDAQTGKPIWDRSLGKPVPLDSLPCGNIDPLGITGTPVIDEASQAIYLDAFVADPSGPKHLVFGLSLRDGSTVEGWPVDVGEALRSAGQTFNPRDQNQRGALTILGGSVYVPFGGRFDCGDYHGWVVGISIGNPNSVRAWSTRASGGGIWAQGGISSDGRALYVATGNTTSATEWSDGEAVIRLAPDLRRSNANDDYFAPADWRSLDDNDADLGSTNPLLLDVPTAEATQTVVLALGKDRRAYLLDRSHLGGIGGALAVQNVATGAIITSPRPRRRVCRVPGRRSELCGNRWKPDRARRPARRTSNALYSLVCNGKRRRIPNRDHYGRALEFHRLDRRSRGRQSPARVSWRYRRADLHRRWLRRSYDRLAPFPNSHRRSESALRGRRRPRLRIRVLTASGQ